MKKIAIITEGKVKKGGISKVPNTPKPLTSPMSQKPLSIIGLANNFKIDENWPKGILFRYYESPSFQEFVDIIINDKQKIRELKQ